LKACVKTFKQTKIVGPGRAGLKGRGARGNF